MNFSKLIGKTVVLVVALPETTPFANTANILGVENDGLWVENLNPRNFVPAIIGQHNLAYPDNPQVFLPFSRILLAWILDAALPPAAK